MPLILILLSTLALVVGLVLTYWVHSQHHIPLSVQPRPLDPALPAPLISVIVPARNEERNIRRCVEALLEQTYPGYELLVLDDRSTDSTSRILAEIESRLTGQAASGRAVDFKVLPGVDLPAGWAGKPHALHQAVQHAAGEWLCFIDADTFARPECLASVYQAALEQRADLFTMLTDQELGSFWEKVILPLVFTGLSFGFPARRINDPALPDAIANGQFILIRRDVYEKTGGHAAVRRRIDEDKALAEVVKRAGYRLVMADGRQVASTRMYTSLPEMWEGWTKNIFLGLRDRLPLLLFGATLGTVGALLLPAWLGGSLVWWAVTGSQVAAVLALQALALWGYLLWVRAQAARAFAVHPAYAFTLPLGALVFTAMMFASTYKVLSRKGVSWRGRVYKN
jgi:chlorobactene glucosyltransferase